MPMVSVPLALIAAGTRAAAAVSTEVVTVADALGAVFVRELDPHAVRVRPTTAALAVATIARRICNFFL